jgi:signal transduction histidine kinase
VSNAGFGERPDDVIDRLQGEVAALRRSRKRLVEAADADRRAIERAFHDGVQQDLVALAIDLQRLAPLVDRDPIAARALRDEMAVNVRKALDQATQLAHMVYPPLLEARGLTSALRAAAQQAGVTALVDVSTGTGYLPEFTGAVYWSCVEVLASAPPGSEATISVLDTDGALTFEVTMVGHPSESRLDRLRDRIESLDGRVSLDVRRDGGLRVQGWLPLSR